MVIVLRYVALSLALFSAAGCSVTGGINGVPVPDAGASSRFSSSPKAIRAASPKLAQSRTVKKLPAPRLEVTAEVRREMDSLLKGNGRYLRECLDRRDKYYPVMAQIFEDEGVPHDLLNLAMVESGYNVQARSNMGAVGMWQFMKSTAKIYGLTVSLFEDQRKDPILSTIAAARHLKDLYLLYEDWYLALAAYNAGPGAVQQVLAKGGKADFWSLARQGRFTKQTRNFVPLLSAQAAAA